MVREVALTERARSLETVPTRPATTVSMARPSLRAVFGRPYLWTSITILSGTVIGSMDSYIVNTSMPRVLGDLGEPQFYAWVSSAFILAQIVGLSIAGAWKDRAGLRTPFLSAVGSDPDHLRLSITAIFTVASVIALFPASIGRPKIRPT
jgi:MFS family permease